MILPTKSGEHTILHYAWLIVVIAVSVQGVASGLRAAFGVFIEPLVDMFGWTSTSVTVAYAIAFILTGLSAPIAGWLTNRAGARKTMLLGAAMFFIGMMGTASIRQVWQLYLWYGGFLGVSSALFIIPIVPSVSTWFRRHAGLGTGFLWLSLGLGPVAAIQVMSALIEGVGWQEAFRIAGIAGTLFILGLLVLFRNSPAEARRKPYGWRPGDTITRSAEQAAPARRREFQRYISKTGAFWNLINIHFLGCVGHAVILVMIIPLAIHRGLDASLAAGVLSTITGVSLLTRFAAPYLSDRFGSRPVMFAAYLGQGLTVLLLLNAESTLAFYVFAVTFAIGYGGEGTVFPIINRQYYGQAPMGATFGWQIFGADLGMALGGVLGAFVFDLTGTYTLAIWLSAAFSLAGAASILLLSPTRRLLIPDWEDEAEPVSAVAGMEGASALPGLSD